MPGQVMESPMHQLPPMAMLMPPYCKGDQAMTVDVGCLQGQTTMQAPASGGGGGAREQCPRCASHDTKFCYYNNYNTSQPRHFCRACRRYWTLGGSLRNVPIGGSTRKRPRLAPRRPPGAVHFGLPPPPAPSHQQPQQQQQGGLLGSLFALGAAPLLEGRVGFDLGLGLPGVTGGGAAVGEMAAGLHGLGLRGGSGGVGNAATTAASPLFWPAGMLENSSAEAWKVAAGGASAMSMHMWPEFSAAAQAGGMLHGGGAHLM